MPREDNDRGQKPAEAAVINQHQQIGNIRFEGGVGNTVVIQQGTHGRPDGTGTEQQPLDNNGPPAPASDAKLPESSPTDTAKIVLRLGVSLVTFLVLGIVGYLLTGKTPLAVSLMKIADYPWHFALAALVALGGLYGLYFYWMRLKGSLLGTRPQGHDRTRKIIMPTRELLIAKSRNLLETSEEAFEHAVDVELGISRVPQLVKALHVPHRGTRGQVEARPLNEPLLDHLLKVERLLVVGAPGAGKTVTLRTLCAQLLSMAKTDPTLPVPLLINFSTFSRYKGTLRDWLAEGVLESAAIPLAIGRELLQQGRLFLLLDGFDEIVADRRAEALIELNALLHAADSALARCVVCSRALEYVDAGIQLALPEALELQPLSPAQVQAAVSHAGPPAAPLAAALANDTMLASLLETPLLLTIAVRVFAGTPSVTLQGHTPAEMLRNLYDAYIAQLLVRTITPTAHPTALTLRWLRWLGQYLRRQQSSLLLIERLQPSALTRLRNYQVAVLLVLGGGFGIVFTLAAGQAFGIGGGLVRLMSGSMLGVALGLVGQEEIIPVEQLRWSWTQAWQTWESDLTQALVVALICCSVMSPLFGLLFGLSLWLGSFVSGGWVRAMNERSGQPNQGIRSSLWHGLREGLVSVLTGGLLCGGASQLVGRQISAVLSGLAGGLLIGLAVGLLVGLGQALKHYVVRLFLWHEGDLPLRLVSWLEDCRSRLLLRRQGGAYLFWHVTLQDYFCELDETRLAAMVERMAAKEKYNQLY